MIRVVFGKACGLYILKGHKKEQVIDGFQVFIRHCKRLIRACVSSKVVGPHAKCSTFIFHPPTTALAILFPTFFQDLN